MERISLNRVKAFRKWDVYATTRRKQRMQPCKYTDKIIIGRWTSECKGPEAAMAYRFEKKQGDKCGWGTVRKWKEYKLRSQSSDLGPHPM